MKRYALGFAFNKSGTFVDYYNPGYNYKVRKILNSPNLSKEIWIFIDDTTMMFGKGNLFIIKEFNSDSLILQPVNSSQNFLKLHVEKDQLTKPE